MDAGPEAYASYLTQVNPDHPKHRELIKCVSHEFSKVEINCSHIEKEAYACVWADYLSRRTSRIAEKIHTVKEEPIQNKITLNEIAKATFKDKILYE